jgi:hypothetical protein
MKTSALFEIGRMPLRAHELLAGIPLHDAWIQELPGGPAGLEISDILDATGFTTQAGVRTGVVPRVLFAIRGAVGGLFGWESADDLVREHSYVGRLTEADLKRTRSVPGNTHGIVRDLYTFENEYAGEIINRTVHAFVVIATKGTKQGYRMAVAIYVARVSWFTRVYMALIAPMTRWVIYPSMRRGIAASWTERFPSNRRDAGGASGTDSRRAPEASPEPPRAQAARAVGSAVGSGRAPAPSDTPTQTSDARAGPGRA